MSLRMLLRGTHLSDQEMVTVLQWTSNYQRTPILLINNSMHTKLPELLGMEINAENLRSVALAWYIYGIYGNQFGMDSTCYSGSQNTVSWGKNFRKIQTPILRKSTFLEISFAIMLCDLRYELCNKTVLHHLQVI